MLGALRPWPTDCGRFHVNELGIGSLTQVLTDVDRCDRIREYSPLVSGIAKNSDTKRGLVSVVMAVFNGEHRVASTVESFIIESSCDCELIVINDGSTDRTPEILDAFSKQDPRIRVIHQRNTGLTRALARGCDEAQGEFIARLDCGDRLISGRLQHQKQALESDDKLVLVSCWTRFCVHSGDELYISKGSGFAHEPSRVLDLTAPHGVLDGPSHHGSVMFRRSSYHDAGGYRPQFYYGQDWDLWYRLFERGSFMMLPMVLYETRIDVADISMNYKRRQRLIGRCSLDALRLRAAGLDEGPALRRAVQIRPGTQRAWEWGGTYRGCYFIGECLRRKGHRGEARKFFRMAVGQNPIHLKSWLRLFQALL